MEDDVKEKRKLGSKNDEALVAAPPKGKKYKWSGCFGLNACPFAFNPDSICLLALCPPCTEEVTEAAGGIQKNKRSRRSSAGATEGVAKSTGEEKRGTCPNHTMADFQHLPFETDDQYLKHKRKKKEEWTSPNIATHCFHCGIKF